VSLSQPARDIVAIELTTPVTGDVGETLDLAMELGEAGADSVSIAAARTNRAQVSVLDLALHLHQRAGIEIGARINPGSRDPEREAGRALSKIEAGVSFFVTRPVYELSGLERLLEAVGGRVPVLAAVCPLTSFAEAEYLAHEVPDVIIPAGTLATLERAGDNAPQADVELAAELAVSVRELTRGIVIAPSTALLATARQLMAC
jgi:homocysteine S-methyltransferase